VTAADPVRAGDRVTIDGHPRVVLGAFGPLVRFAGDDGAVEEAAVAELVGSGRMRLQPRGPGGHPPALAGLAGLPPEAVERARWWEPHIIEVVDGTPPDAPAGTPPRPAYDPERTSLAGREQAKAAELSVQGRQIAASTVKHRRQRWQAEGLPGLVDKRVQRRSSPAGRADPAVAGAMEQAIAEATDDSSRAATFIVWRTRQILAGQRQSGLEPSRATMFRLFSRLSAGKHTTGSAATRRGLAGRPQRKFSQAHPAAPGELMEIDSTPLDVLVLLDDGVPGRVELTGLIDVATRTVPAAVIRPTAKSVDASVLLARALAPEPMRPGWPASLAMAHSALPYDRLLGIDERLRHAAARPVIVPDTIVIDHGSVFVSDNFRASCRHPGISIQPAHLATGSDKPHIEKMFSSLGTLFCQFAAGYLGRLPSHGPPCPPGPGGVKGPGHQVQALQCCLLVREVAAGLDRAPVAGVEGLDGVGGADDLADLDVVVQEGDELAPGVLPEPDDGAVPLSPPVRQLVERCPGRLGAHRRVDGPGIAAQGVPVALGGQVEGIADEVNVMPTSA
jgi:hypothetical protein